MKQRVPEWGFDSQVWDFNFNMHKPITVNSQVWGYVGKFCFQIVGVVLLTSQIHNMAPNVPQNE